MKKYIGDYIGIEEIYISAVVYVRKTEINAECNIS